MTSEEGLYPSGPQTVNSRFRILVVVDAPDAAKLLTLFLESKGHSVQSARNGTEALVVADDFLPDVVLLDLGLPGLDGMSWFSVKWNFSLLGVSD